MPLTAVTITHVSDAGDLLTIRGTFKVTGNYTAASGETLALQAAIMAGLAAARPPGVPAIAPPVQAAAWPRAGGAAAGLTVGANPNATVIHFYTAAGVELTGAPTAYPAYMLADTYDFCLDFQKLN